MPKAVVFDMDGLLLDTEKLLVKFWIQAAHEAGFEMTRETALNLRSLHRSFAVPYLKGLFGESFDYIKIRSRRMELMRGYLSENPLELKKGAKELLEYLCGKNIPAAVCTATDNERAAEYLKTAGIFDYFGKIICASMVKKGKPEPDIYLYAANVLGYEPRECIALEDSPNGIKSALSAGFITIMIPDLTKPDEKSDLFGTADSLYDVIGIIENMQE